MTIGMRTCNKSHERTRERGVIQRWDYFVPEGRDLAKECSKGGVKARSSREIYNLAVDQERDNR